MSSTITPPCQIQGLRLGFSVDEKVCHLIVIPKTQAKAKNNILFAFRGVLAYLRPYSLKLRLDLGGWYFSSFPPFSYTWWQTLSVVLFTGRVSLHTCHLLSIFYHYFTLSTIMRYSMDDLTMSASQSQFMFEAKLHFNFSNELPWEIDCAL